jgi:4-amino-4-deoxy-L-arabinose transferase-like glycosyltransferase
VSDTHTLTARVGMWDRAGVLLLAVALLAGGVFGARGITDESATSLHGDVPRHMMNGVFLFDLLRSGSMWSVDSAVTYAQEYFVRYPALSLGHHPPLTAVILVPFYAVFGISVFAARLAMVACMLVAIVAMYSLTRRLYGPAVAGWASLLFAVQPAVVPYWQQVMSEAPLIAVVLLAADALLRFCASGRAGHYAAFVILAAVTLYAKQTGAILFPLYACTLLARLPLSRLIRRDILGWTLVGALLCVPILIATLTFSPHNVAVVVQTTANVASTAAISAPNHAGEAGAATNVSGTALRSVLNAHLSAALVAAMIAALVASAARRDARVVFALVWMISSLAGVLLLIGPYEAERYAALAVPAYCLCAAAVATVDRPRGLHWVAVALLTTTILWDAVPAARVRPVGAGGYEEAARYVTSRSDSPTVLYGASVDTGYFIFFVRKHDDDRKQIVLRSDKMLTTSLLGALGVETHITEPEDIYPLLRKSGTRLVVIEDHATGEPALDWLRAELTGPRFIERQRLPIATRDGRVSNVDVVTYEYRDATPPDPDASIEIGLPLIGRDLRVQLSDLLGTRRRR